MTATQLALGIFFGFAGLEVFKVVVVMIHEGQKRRAMKADLEEVATGFIDKMHNDLMADRAAEEAKAAKRRKPATKKAPVKKPVAKPAVKKTVTAKKGK